MPLLWCDRCPACVAGNRHICQNLVFVGIDSPGALQQSWTVPESLLVKLPDSVDLRTGALAEPLSVAVHDVRRGAVAPGDRILVVGGGPIGILIACVAEGGARGGVGLGTKPVPPLGGSRPRTAGDRPIHRRR